MKNERTKNSAQAKREKRLSSILSIVMMLAIGVVFGIISSFIIDYDQIFELDILKSILLFLSFFLSCLIGIYLHIFLHELGHFVFGRLSSYTLQSFRIGNHILVPGERGYTIKKYTLQGTAGQCLMRPPHLGKEKPLPFLLYNLGGAIFNIVFSVLFVFVAYLLRTNIFLSIAFMGLAIIGVILGLSNAIPVKIAGFPTDGYNIKAMLGNKEAQEAFALQLEQHARLAEGQTYTDMPEAFFALPSEQSMENHLVAWRASLRTAYLMVKEEFDAVVKLSEDLLSNEAIGFDSITRKFIINDWIFASLILDPEADLTRFMDTDYEKYSELMKNNLSFARTRYAIARAKDKSEAEVREKKGIFNDALTSHPVKGECIQEEASVRAFDKKMDDRLEKAIVF